MSSKKTTTAHDILIFARSILPSLTQKEKRITTFLLESPSELAEMTINEVSQRLDVSEATIVKLCKKLNCDGYLSLKRTLQNYSPEKNSYLFQQEFKEEDQPEDIFLKVFNNSIIALQDTISGIDRKEFNRAVSTIKKANKLLLMGLGGSGTIADDIAHKFLKVGIEAHSYRDTHMQSMAASLLNKNDIVIGISHSGTTTSIINALRTAKEAGATTMCLTNHVQSPITKYSDIQLVSFAENSPLSGENAVTRIVHLNILDAIYMSIVLDDIETSSENLRKTNLSVKNQRINGRDI